MGGWDAASWRQRFWKTTRLSRQHIKHMDLMAMNSTQNRKDIILVKGNSLTQPSIAAYISYFIVKAQHKYAAFSRAGI